MVRKKRPWSTFWQAGNNMLDMTVGRDIMSTSLRFAKFFGVSEDFWMNLQIRWDLYRAKKRTGYLNKDSAGQKATSRRTILRNPHEVMARRPGLNE